MIQAVLLDLFETLVTESAGSIRRAGSLAAELGVDENGYRQQWRSLRPDIVRGRCQFREALTQIVRTLGGRPDEDLVEQLWSERVRQKATVLRTVEADVLGALDALRDRGVKLAVVTNSFAEDVAGWESSPLRSYFDMMLPSCAIGIAKPNPEIYLLACRELGVAPSHALFVGDGADDELNGARSAGLHTCRALWFLSRWSAASLAHDEPGLWHPADLVAAVMAVRVNTP
jgi:HAD superfamily hydrolase (TIGR01509 family)